MKITLIFLLSFISLQALAQDGVWLTQNDRPLEGVMMTEGFRIRNGRAQIVRVAVSSHGIEGVYEESKFLSERPTYIDDRIYDDVDLPASERNIYCDTTFATATWNDDGDLEIRRFTLRRSVTFTCPFSKSIASRGGEATPLSEVRYKLSDLDSNPKIEQQTRNRVNTGTRGFTGNSHVHNSSNNLLRVAD